MKKSIFLLCFLFSSIWGAEAQTLYLHYNFDQPLEGGKVVDLSGTGRDGILKEPGKVGQGELLGDAFDNTASTMGQSGSGGGSIYGSQGFGTITSFTISLWYKTDSASGLSQNARLFDTQLGGSLFVLADPGGTTGALQLYSDISGAKALIQKADPIYSAPGGGVSDKWVFVAVTYDGSISGQGTFNLYAGSQTEGVKLVQSVVSTAIAGPKGLNNISFGGSATGNRSFSGWLDDIRVYGGYGSSAAGALSLSELEQVRLEAIPEPACISCAVAGLAVFAMLSATRLRQWKGY